MLFNHIVNCYHKSFSQCIADTKDEVRDFEIITLSFRFVNGITSTGNRQAKQTLL